MPPWAATTIAGAVLLYDEAHLLADDRSRERYPLSSLLAALGAVQRRSRASVSYSSACRPCRLNLKRARTYAERMFRHVVVGNLEPDDARDALTVPLEGSGRSFALGALSIISSRPAGAYPYFLQFMAAYACRSVTTAEVDLAAYQAAEPALLHELDLAFFDDRFEGASPAEQRLLRVMAREPGLIRLAGLRRDRP